jgi:hypothetical protein
MRALLVLAVALFVLPQAEGEYVLVKQGTKEYHRPGCEVVRDTTKVVAMTRGEAESRGYKPHPACDPANAKAAKPAVQYVFVEPGGKLYHRETCSKLGKKRERMTLDEAGKKYWPCSVCKPPIRKHAA